MPSLSLRLTLLRDISTAPVMATAKQEQPEQKKSKRYRYSL